MPHEVAYEIQWDHFDIKGLDKKGLRLLLQMENQFCPSQKNIYQFQTTYQSVYRLQEE